MSDIKALHGGLHHDEISQLALNPADILDFSVNINPYGPAAAVLRASHETCVRSYGDPTAAATRAVLASRLGVASVNVALGNGAAELMWSLARVLSDDHRPALIVEPTFSEYWTAIDSHGGKVTAFKTNEDTGFEVDLSELERQIHKEHAQSLYICTPNNPTGTATSMESLVRLADACPETTIIIDQAFLSLSPQYRELRMCTPPANVVLLRSLTKDHAVPGLRVAYLVAQAAIVRTLETKRPPWTVSTPAQASLLASLDEIPFIDECRERMQADTAYLASGLQGINLRALPSNAPFLIARVGNATDLRKRGCPTHC